uniref:Potassium/proton antiporter CemA n=1 Tax=Marvania geminata TaxID=97105 RepID=A0A097KR34_9CHLO|nr:chloroplast enveloppe membrane protein [Marvania geminata]AIT95646.1 chloroplast enveloppe membrane protein [Marvania geminata]
MAKRAIEQTGLIPRSIIRTFERFKNQLFPGSEMLVIQEFRISRYQVIVSVQCLATLILTPLCVNLFSKIFFITPLVDYVWNKYETEIFLNSQQQNSAVAELKFFEEKLYFESLLEQDIELLDGETKTQFSKKLQAKTFEIAEAYNTESIQAISNLFADFLSFCSLGLVFLLQKPQVIILKSFLAESLYSLSDTTKSFLLILSTDLLVGFHSPRGWEVFLEWVFHHFGFPENTEFMSLFVATFPVFLDTVFKYWIFRSLNKISPSTVATYHNMIE